MRKPHPTPSSTLDEEFAEGVSLWAQDEETVIAVDHSEQFVALSVEPEAIGKLLAHDFDASRLTRYQAALDGLREHDYIVTRTTPFQIRVGVEGDGTLAHAVRALMSDLSSDETPAQQSDRVTIRVSDTPLTAAQADGQAVPAFGEGACVALGPWHLPTDTTPDLPDFSDLVARRLSVHPAPELLNELWNFNKDRPSVRARPSITTCFAAAARLRWELDRGLPYLRTHQILVHPDLTVSTHRVLPVPHANAWCAARPLSEDIEALTANGESV